MHDETQVPLPDRFRDRALQERREHEIGPPQLDGLAGHAIVNVELDRELVAVLRELDVQALRQAVERVHEQQDAHQATV